MPWLDAPSVLARQSDDNGPPHLPDALVVRANGDLWCYGRGAETPFEGMTVQNGYHEGRLSFPDRVDILWEKCFPAILRRIIERDLAYVAIVYMDLVWTAEDLRAGLAAHEKVMQRDGFPPRTLIRAYIAAKSDVPILQYEMECNADGKNEHSVYRGGARKGAAIQNATSARPVAVFAGRRDAAPQQLSALDDIPAEFDHIVWTLDSRKQAGSSSLGVLPLHRLPMKGACFTTREAAERLFPKPTLAHSLRVFRMLRSAYGSLASVPMVGFKGAYLTATSHLAPYTDLAECDLDLDRLDDLRSIRFGVTDVQQDRDQRIVVSAHRCLAMTSQGLGMLDLCEDIICDLTGVTTTVMSLADVCRVYRCLRR